MELNRIITRAASAYPECWVMQYWDMKKECAVSNRDGGDTLAEFIAHEIEATYDPDASESEQINTAARKIQEAANDLQVVATAIDNLQTERMVA